MVAGFVSAASIGEFSPEPKENITLHRHKGHRVQSV
jgi:hypothetical protein